jgi:integrase
MHVLPGHAARATEETSHHGSPHRRFSEQGNVRQGFFERHELEALISLLPPYLKDVVRFAYHTGWRKSEILTLEWSENSRTLLTVGGENG